MADFVVIDSAPLTAVVDALPFAQAADDVLIVARLGHTRLNKLAELDDLLGELGVARTGIVLIGEHPARGLQYYYGEGDDHALDDARWRVDRAETLRKGRPPALMAFAGRISPLNRWLLACLGVCVAIGVLAGINPEYGLVGALGVMLAVITIMDLTLGFVLFTIASFLDLTSSTGSFSGIKVVGLVLFVSWLARIGTRRSTEIRSFAAENPMLAASLVAMLGWAALSFAWAFSPSTALGGAGRYALDMMLLPIGYAAMRERRHVVWVLTAYVAGAALSAVYGFATSSAAGFSGRLAGSIGDPNAEATVLAASIPLLIGLVACPRVRPDEARRRGRRDHPVRRPCQHAFARRVGGARRGDGRGRAVRGPMARPCGRVPRDRSVRDRRLFLRPGAAGGPAASHDGRHVRPFEHLDGGLARGRGAPGARRRQRQFHPRRGSVRGGPERCRPSTSSGTRRWCTTRTWRRWSISAYPAC